MYTAEKCHWTSYTATNGARDQTVHPNSAIHT